MKSIKKKLTVYAVKITYYDRQDKQSHEWETEIFNRPTTSRISALLKQVQPMGVLCDFVFSESKKTFEIPMKTFIMHATEVKND